MKLSAAQIKKEHERSTLQTYLKEIVYGGSDGIVTTFAVVAGFTGAQSGNAATYSFFTVLLFGLANLCADGVSMGLGNFLSLRAEQDLYKTEAASERNEIRTRPEKEKEETIEILMDKGFSKIQAKKLTQIYATNESYWVQFMMNHELERPDISNENPALNALATFTAFVVFGFIPLIPYFLGINPIAAFASACIATFIALVLLGVLRWSITNENILRSIGEIVAIGTVSASIAYLVGSLFRG